MRKEEVVSCICSSCSFSCFAKNCPRGEYHGEPSLPKVGKDEVCPLLSFERKEPSRMAVSVADTWKVCAACQYFSVDHIPEDNFREHCMDCPCLAVREAVEEANGEAYSS